MEVRNTVPTSSLANTNMEAAFHSLALIASLANIQSILPIAVPLRTGVIVYFTQLPIIISCLCPLPEALLSWSTHSYVRFWSTGTIIQELKVQSPSRMMGLAYLTFVLRSEVQVQCLREKSNAAVLFVETRRRMGGRGCRRHPRSSKRLVP